MNVFQAWQSRRQSSAVDSDHLPELNAFVDVAAGGITEHLPIEELGRTQFKVRRPARITVGAPALFNYVNGQGRFRFHADCTALEERMATFALPEAVTIIERFGDKRRNFRLKIALPIRWRYAPDGVGYGEFVPGNTVNLSAVGLALIVPRELRQGTQLEVALDLRGGDPVVVVGTLTRASQKQAAGKYLAGLCFLDIRPTKANAIADFIASRQQGHRKRSLAEDWRRAD